MRFKIGDKITALNGEIGTVVEINHEKELIGVSYFEEPFSVFAKQHKPKYYPFKRVAH